MTVCLQLLPVLAGTLALMPLAVPGVCGLNPLSLIPYTDNIRINEIGSREFTSASPKGSTVSSRQLFEEPQIHDPLEKLPDISREGLILPHQPPSTQASSKLLFASLSKC